MTEAEEEMAVRGVADPRSLLIYFCSPSWSLPVFRNQGSYGCHW